jgi:hypothetical protein
MLHVFCRRYHARARASLFFLPEGLSTGSRHCSLLRRAQSRSVAGHRICEKPHHRFLGSDLRNGDPSQPTASLLYWSRGLPASLFETLSASRPRPRLPVTWVSRPPFAARASQRAGYVSANLAAPRPDSIACHMNPRSAFYRSFSRQKRATRSWNNSLTDPANQVREGISLGLVKIGLLTSFMHLLIRLSDEVFCQLNLTIRAYLSLS